MIAVVAGASGLVGRELVRELLASESCERVYALVRSPLAATPTHPKLTQIQADFTRLAEPPAPIAGAHLFCALGTTIKKAGSQDAFRAVDQGAVLAYASWGREHGAERFLAVSSLGADPSSSVFYSRVKGETERDLAKLSFSSLVFFRPSLLLGRSSERRPGEIFAAALMKPAGRLLRGPLAKYRPIEASVVARAMVRVSKGALERPVVRIIESDEIAALGRTGGPRGHQAVS